uniref:30S ribosomal protein S17 n=1 Tax=Chromera velia CCMP2878 TaxID=1169474 RepID=A0A0G4H065_9ALVE|mmetsp:Transcript_16854/g.34236  ORF Transcript_16854/g.34236 Transcript_16854/m.34236 type:complete len:144 (+) Transcript_16854:295-726(+)|eukprot:Cvel_24058.t1-p1 / transcript=Cvel_24058.t1 / gene=Cvel_24058 / organism=Chromera_velia_CCMP2878 / gene_product=30S ribosomal protein S17, putative / transcript_product=30S ribosomal protein S17, putative / location=Cvel_scaffold2559:14105-14533(-) / protein_length=143 / sequence_SO=supercontig / SO=protein_coding / is_pseudo=false
MFLTRVLFDSGWHYKTWQRQTAGWLRTFAKNRLPNNEMIGYVINDKHPKSIRVACDRYMYSVRYKKTFRLTKKIWCHDEASEAKMGDIVRIQPLGYRIGPWKTYVLVRILHAEQREETVPQPAIPDDGKTAAGKETAGSVGGG